MKSLRYLAAACAASLALAGCGGATGNPSASSSASGDCGSADVFCIGMVTDMGKVDDKSFNQSTWEGVQAAAKSITGAKTKYIETVNTTDYAANLKMFTDAKYDVVVTVGFAIGTATKEAAAANTKTVFIGIDQDHSQDNLSNLVGLVFPEDQGGYAAGFLAGKLTKTGKVGQVLGMEIPPVKRWATGFENGAKAANPAVVMTTVYHPAGDTAFNDPAWGAAEAQKQLDQKVDVIFGAGGATGNGALGQIAKASGAGTSVFCIGVDTDQWETVPDARPCLVTSGMKMIVEGTSTLVQQAKDGKLKGGNFVGQIGLAPYHDFNSKIPADVKDAVTKVLAGLKDGSISTGVTG